MTFRFYTVVLAGLLAAAPQSWAMTAKAAIADPKRPADQVVQDPSRKPG